MGGPRKNPLMRVNLWFTEAEADIVEALEAMGRYERPAFIKQAIRAAIRGGRVSSPVSGVRREEGTPGGGPTFPKDADSIMGDFND